MKKERKVWAISLIALGWLAPHTNFAQQNQDSVRILQELVVTGTKFELPIEKSGKFILKLGEQQLREQSGRNLSEMLNNLAAIQVDGNFGTPGTNLNYYVRGGRNRQSLIVVDGIPMNDPSGIDAFFDLRYVAPDQLKSVEVLEGGLSTLYGSSAAAAVINIETRGATNQGVHGSVDFNAGSWNTFGQNISLSAKSNKFSAQLFGNNYTSQGFSAALDQNNTDAFDKDGITRVNGLIKVGYQFSDRFKLDVFAGRDGFDANYDAGAFRDADNRQVLFQNRLGLKAFYSYAHGNVQVVAQQLSNNRDFRTSLPTTYEGSNSFAEIIHSHRINSFAKVISGLSFQQFRYGEKNRNASDTTSFTIIDPYTSLFLDFDNGLQIHAGTRVNTHSQYGSKLLQNLNPSYLFKLNTNSSVKVFGSVSSSFITPSLYQLYSPFGNKKLRPEENTNYEYGITFFKKNLTISAVNFFRNEINTIGFLTTRYENLSANRRVSGITFDAVYQVNNRWTVRADYTSQDTDNTKTFYRIPQIKWGAGVHYRPEQNTVISLNYLHTGTRTDLFFDQNFNANEVTLLPYDLINFSASHEMFDKKLLVYGHLNNALDEKFVGVYGFTTQGRNFTLGARYQF